MLVLDLDVISPEPKELKLGGRTFNLAAIPFKTSLALYGQSEVFGKMQALQPVTAEEFDNILSICADVLNSTSDGERVDSEWVNKNVTFAKMPAFIEFMFKCAFDDGKKKAEADDHGESTAQE